ncbi:MAG TPA: site-specific DNA-methyltransferase [Thermomicrobiaceae bacterium]|nr:site-specific DNA-methyltransferase [Thermomicrobiaceae bacterium]
MAQRAKRSPEVADYRYDEASRKNIPSAGNAAQGTLHDAPRRPFSYDPHRPPELRFDASGREDGIPALLAEALARPLTADEVRTLTAALRDHQPWLEWAGKREARGFEVEPLALNIHERVSAQAILKVAARQPVQRSLFADPELDYREAVQFYRHDVDWSNRLILGDSLQVMTSLAYREDLAGKVQMIYMDPPYGIKFASNFQTEIGKRDVKDKESDLTREPEMVKAYRDTWTLGVHSYLAYLRDRLILCRELLTDSGSIFVQIGQENAHLVRSVLDDVLGQENFIDDICFLKTGGLIQSFLPATYDHLLWYGKEKTLTKYYPLFAPKAAGAGSDYQLVSLVSGERRRLNRLEAEDLSTLHAEARVFQSTSLESANPTFGFSYQNAEYRQRWKSNLTGLSRLASANRLYEATSKLRYVRYVDDFPVIPLTDVWMDTGSSGYRDASLYAVQTVDKVIARCMLMTTDPGDLVLDPTSGSGTTAYVAEQWGRRWIAIDTSRVANAIARERILTASFPMYRVRGDDAGNPAAGFIYKTVPHITLKSIAQNVALDPIFATHQPILDAKLAALNQALARVTPAQRSDLLAKLAHKEQAEGKRAVSEADRRRWLLPKDGWQEWQAPYDADDDWPEPLKQALRDYRAAWRAKMDEVNACIAAHAEQEELVDQPEIVKGVTRVSGPFSVEAVIPQEESLDGASPIGGAPEELDSFEAHGGVEAANGEAYLDRMIGYLRADGVRFPDNRVLSFARLEPLAGGDFIHAEGEWRSDDGAEHRVAVSFGPEFGPVTGYQVEQTLRMANRRGYDDLLFAGFTFDAAAQAIIQEDPHPRVRSHLALIRPDVNMDGLLKTVPNSQIFTVFGLPRTVLHPAGERFTVEMQGVDIYDPVANTVHATRADKVAAWFLDSDYDGQTFCITQAFFPDKDAWKKLARALKGAIDEERFAQLAGSVSLPFPPGRHRQAAVKVIDPRGNEVLRVHRLDDEVRYGGQ